MKQITCPHCGDTYPDFDAAHVCSRGPYAVKLKPKMNERIRQLAEQAGLVRRGDWGMKRWEGPRSDSINDQDLEKFAELIVKECAGVADHSNVTGKSIIGQRIKEHFGVEE